MATEEHWELQYDDWRTLRTTVWRLKNVVNYSMTTEEHWELQYQSINQVYYFSSTLQARFHKKNSRKNTSAMLNVGNVLSSWYSVAVPKIWKRYDARLLRMGSRWPPKTRHSPHGLSCRILIAIWSFSTNVLTEIRKIDRSRLAVSLKPIKTDTNRTGICSVLKIDHNGPMS